MKKYGHKSYYKNNRNYTHKYTISLVELVSIYPSSSMAQVFAGRDFYKKQDKQLKTKTQNDLSKHN
jgi:hypothetical protein